MPAPVISARDVHVTYRSGGTDFKAVEGASLDITAGSSLAVVGRSGSGKSTLMHVLSLLQRPSAGHVSVDGRATESLSTTQLSELRNETFGFVFQQFFLIPHRTVLDNVTVPLMIAGLSTRERNRRAMRVLEALDLEDKAKNRATDLSGGQKQRMVIARALITEPRVVFADEPTGNLDSTTGGQVADLLFDLNRDHGITLVLVTHDEQLAQRCDEKVQVVDGHLAARIAGAAA